MAIHELVVENGDVRFRCNAKPENENSPPCWYSFERDEDGNEISSEDLGECNAAIWYGEDGFETDAEICIPVDLNWRGQEKVPIRKHSANPLDSDAPRPTRYPVALSVR